MPLLKPHDHEGRGRILTIAGLIDHKRGRFDSSLSRYEHAVALLRNSGSRGALAVALRCAGSLCLDLGDLELAERYIDQALALGDAHGHFSWLRVQLIFGELQTANDHLAHAQQIFTDVLEAAHQADSPRLRFEALYGLGTVQQRRGDHNNAGAYFHAALSQSRIVPEHDHHVRLLLALAENQHKLHHLDEALNYLHQATTLSRRLQLPHWSARATEALHQIQTRASTTA
jgi:tetratricopeptide (TPR) repeat protein